MRTNDYLSTVPARDCDVGIYLPKGNIGGATGHVEQTLALFGRMFGGATCSDARGVWVSPEERLIEDELCIVRSFTTSMNLDRYFTEIVAYAERLKSLLRQEAIAVEIQGRLLLV